MVREYEDLDTTNMNEIIPGLWLGDLRSALDTQDLREKNIHSVLSAMRGTVTVSQVRVEFVRRSSNESNVVDCSKVDLQSSSNQSRRHGRRRYSETSRDRYILHTS